MFRYIKQRGVVAQAPVVMKVYASGVIQPGEAVEWSRTLKQIIPASSSSTYTNIFGIALDTVRSNSDSLCRVVPFVQGQLWGADVTSTPTTAMLFIKHSLSDRTKIANTSYDTTTALGVFVAYSIDKTLLVGEFIRGPVGWAGTDTKGYF